MAACIDFLGVTAMVFGVWYQFFILTAALNVQFRSLTCLYFGANVGGLGAGFLLWAAHGAYVSTLVPKHELGMRWDSFGASSQSMMLGVPLSWRNLALVMILSHLLMLVGLGLIGLLDGLCDHGRGAFYFFDSQQTRCQQTRCRGARW